MNQLHPGARWQFRITVYTILIFLSLFIGWIFFAGLAFLLGVLTTIIIYLIIIVGIGEIYARMAYNRWFYEFTKDGLKLERGIIWKRYSNVPYERIQNVDIHRGLIARMCGFSSLMI